MPSDPLRRSPLRRGRRLALLALLGLASIAFLALGTWQLERRVWKLDLIRRIAARVHAPAGDPPGPAAWAYMRAADDEYRHVRVTGTYQTATSALVQAVTDLGPGFWLLTPLRRSDDGSTVFINRGFVTDRRAARATDGPIGAVTVTGLLRLSEPGGGFLRRNDPVADRWYSRDVAAIAAARGLGVVAPYFIDAEAATSPPALSPANDQPVGGLTVVAFHNNHLVYALTWYGLAALAVVGIRQVLRAEGS